MPKYDAVVIGAGPGGTECARVMGRHGLKVALVEAAAVGGTCINKGCIPAKTMLWSAEMYRHAHKLHDYGIDLGDLDHTFDFGHMVDFRSEVISHLKEDEEAKIKRDGVELVYGYGELVEDKKVLVNGEDLLEAENVVIATGGRARKFPGFKDGDKRYLVADNIFELEELPKSIMIVGAGPVGAEFAVYFQTFGVEVVIVDLAENALNRYDLELGNELMEIYKKKGIQVELGTLIEGIDDSGEMLKVELKNGKSFEVEKVLSAIGVEPVTDFMKQSGVEVSERGRIIVDEFLETSESGVYALGDIIGKSGSAYGAQREGALIAHLIMDQGYDDLVVDYKYFPDVIFTYPEVATCGVSEEELSDEGVEYVVGRALYADNGKALLKGEREGFCKVLVRKDDGVVMGVHMIGDLATEIIHTVSLPLMKEMTAKCMLQAVWGHPVVAEIVRDALIDAVSQM
jgi:dihydrolipoamide dehydrogenase